MEVAFSVKILWAANFWQQSNDKTHSKIQNWSPQIIMFDHPVTFPFTCLFYFLSATMQASKLQAKQPRSLSDINDPKKGHYSACSFKS